MAAVSVGALAYLTDEWASTTTVAERIWGGPLPSSARGRKLRAQVFAELREAHQDGMVERRQQPMSHEAIRWDWRLP